MTLQITARKILFGTGSGTSVTTGAATLRADRAYTMVVMYEGSSQSAVPHPTCSGFVEQEYQTDAVSDTLVVTVLHRPTGDGTTGTRLIDFGGVSTFADYWIFEWMPVSGVVGTAVVVQSNKAQGFTTIATVSLSAFADAIRNATFFVVGALGGDQHDMLPPNGYFFLAYEGNNFVAIGYKVGQDVAPSSNGAMNERWLAVAMEIAAGIPPNVIDYTQFPKPLIAEREQGVS